jgi:hypothetical protein
MSGNEDQPRKRQGTKTRKLFVAMAGIALDSNQRSEGQEDLFLEEQDNS